MMPIGDPRGGRIPEAAPSRRLRQDWALTKNLAGLLSSIVNLIGGMIHLALPASIAPTPPVRKTLTAQSFDESFLKSASVNITILALGTLCRLEAAGARWLLKP